MWGFKRPLDLKPMNAAPSTAHLEARMADLECSILLICQAFREHKELCNVNFATLEEGINTLANYVVHPRTNILGDKDSQKKN